MDKMKFWNLFGTMWNILDRWDSNGNKLYRLINKTGDVLDRYVEGDIYFEVLDIQKEINEFSNEIKEDFSYLQNLINKLVDEVKNRQ